AREVHFVEAHGTGTVLGDPIELESIAAVYGHAGAEPCAVGAIKSNLGHTEAAAGMAGLIKLALCVQRGSIVPNVNFSVLNERVHLGDSRLFVPTRPMEWPSQSGARAGAVSCFGMSGTNTHVLVASQAAPPSQTSDASREHYLVRLSAKSPRALTALAQSYAVQLEGSGASLADVAYSANERRSVFEHRLCAVADNTRSLSEQLAAHAQSGKTDPNVLLHAASPGRRLAFVFSGQGSLRAGAGLELYRTEPAFFETFERCRQILLPNGIDILALLRSDASGLRRTRVAQPVMYALQSALVDLLGAWGIRPQVVIGHSVGEFAAAYCAGALELEAGCRLVWRRAELMDALPEGGEMRAFAGSEATLQRALTRSGSAAEVAAVNAETEIVVSGPAAELELLARELGTEGTPLAVSHAFHSALMDPMLPEFSLAARAVQCADELRCQFASTYLGRLVDAKDLHGDYWVRQLRSKVRFADAVKVAQTPAVTEWLEIGSRPLLLALLGRNGVDSRALRLPTLVPGESESAQLLRTVAALHARGAELDFRAIDRGARRNLVSVPTYQFQRARHWLETTTTPVAAAPVDASNNSYELAWVPVVRLPRSVLRARHWLLLCPDAKLAGELTRLAGARGIEVRTVTTHALLRSLAEIDAAQSVEVVDVRPLLWQQLPNEEELLPEAASKQFAGCYDSARAGVDSHRDARLWLVTANAAGAATAARPEGACAWGFGRSFDLEHPRHFGGLVDLCGAAYGSLVDEIADSDGERQVVLGDGIRRVARVSRLATVPSGEFRASGRGVFVVAGGTGSLGLRLSEWLVGRGARRIALLSRHAPEIVGGSRQRDIATGEILERLRAAGCELAAFAVDIADRDSVSSVFRQIEGTLGPIRGVLHAAGSSPRAPIATATPVIIEQTFRSKALGAANLHLASRG
ncbi:MAG TPA: type I polyketide synthase, partial [Polyangiaceae bacterium]|nr:type I polyketide synthase [Polyangiaceae bacterium]